MARRRSAKSTASAKKNVQLDFGTVSEPQARFLASKTFFTCYGGARGGGKTHIARVKAVGMAVYQPGIRILMIRCHYPELEENLVRPILKWVPQEMYSYNGTLHLMRFSNGSEIKFGHYDGDGAENEYQGAQYDCIFIDEATQLSERAFNYLVGCIRGTGNYPRRMYLTCNPGGVGHRWVKRLFITRKYVTNDPNPEKNENPEDYTFIPATVDDNPFLLESSPMYKKQLAQLPDDLMRAHRYGDWDALSGSYFKNFAPATHVIAPFRIPAHWPRYRSFDYGFDMFSCGWWAVDEDGRSWLYRYYEEKGLVAQAAAKAITDHTPPNEVIQATYAPPDIWAKSKDTGVEIAEKFALNGVPLIKASNNRVQGHMVMKDAMTPSALKDPYVIGTVFDGEAPDELPMLMFFQGETQRCVDDICDIQADGNNPNDCAKTPHSVTHSVDMVRYYSISRVLTAEPAETQEPDYDGDDREMDYEEFMCGADVTEDYMGFY